MTIAELQYLAGVNTKLIPESEGINISRSGTELRQLERKLKLKPGDPDWFKLWFSRPYWTGFPSGFRGRK